MPTNKKYYIEIKMNSRWTLVHTEDRHTDALAYVKTNTSKYPYRIVRVVRTVVFDGSK